MMNINNLTEEVVYNKPVVFKNTNNNLLTNMFNDLKGNIFLKKNWEILLMNNFCMKLKDNIYKNNDFNYNLFEIRDFLNNYKNINKILEYYQSNLIDYAKLLKFFKTKTYDFHYEKIKKCSENKRKKFNLDDINTDDNLKSKISLKKRLFLNQEAFKSFYYQSLSNNDYFFKCKWYTNVKIPFNEIAIFDELRFLESEVVSSSVIQNYIDVNTKLIKGWMLLDRKICKNLKKLMEVEKQVLKKNLNKLYDIYLFNNKNLNSYYLKEFNVESSVKDLDKILLFIIVKNENTLEFVSKDKLTKIKTATVKSETDNYFKLVNNISLEDNLDPYNILNDSNQVKENFSKDNIILQISNMLIDIKKFNIIKNILLLFEDINIIYDILGNICNVINLDSFDYNFWNLNKGNLNIIMENLKAIVGYDEELFKSLINNTYIILKLSEGIRD